MGVQPVLGITLLVLLVTTIQCSPTNHHIAKRETCLRLYGTTNNCNNHGRCVQTLRPNAEHTLCDCMDDTIKAGETCEFQVTASCDDNPCADGSICKPRSTNEINGFICECQRGYSGTYCDVPLTSICANSTTNPCQKEITDEYVGKRKVITGICRPGETDNEYTCDCYDDDKMRGQRCDEIQQCNSDRCKNGGTCSNTGLAGSWRCACRPGYIGQTCDVFDDPCSPSPCVLGSCVVISATTFQCNCPPGITGITCDRAIVDPCLTRPCQNDGTCTAQDDQGNGYFCTCPPGFAGQQCTIRTDPCSSSPCALGATCVVISPTASQCMCPPGITGITCDRVIVDPCFSRPCQNGGTCMAQDDGRNGYLCTCQLRFAGPQCTIRTDPCLSRPCQNGGTCTASDNQGNGYFCTCPPGFAGPQCTFSTVTDICSTFPCRNQATCINVGAEAFRCMCRPGFTGTDCSLFDPCGSSPCMNGGSCSRRGGGFDCQCIPGFVGEICQQYISTDACVPNPCQNGGACMRGSGGSFMCMCPDTHSGDTCTISRTINNFCLPNPCFNEATCVMVSMTEYKCICQPGFSGITCNRGNENTVNPCLARPCQNEGTCTADNQGNGYSCTCPSGFAGQQCNINIQTCEVNPCRNGATCYNAYSSQGYMCGCSPGYTGINCDRQDPCAGSPCGPEEQCVATSNGNYKCLCSCMDDPDDQRDGPCSVYPCKNGATCTNTGSSSSAYFCTCAPNYVGQNCEVFFQSDPCVSNPCGSSSSCSRTSTGYSCSPGPIFIDPCINSPCQNDGICQRTGTTSYICNCRPGYSGNNCNIALTCSFDYCKNGGTCVRDGNSLECTCPPMFYGAQCKNVIDPCATSNIKCENDGTCMFNMAGLTSCQCKDGFTGNRCEQLTSLCANNECLNGGACLEDRAEGDYMCVCKRGFHGRFCERVGVKTPPEGCPQEEMKMDQFKSCLRLDAVSKECSGIGSCIPATANTNAYCCCGKYHESMDNGLGCKLITP